MKRLQRHRRFYANFLAATAGIPAGSRLAEAFASTPRENFVGPGPWKVDTNSGYIETPSDDPLFLYQNIAVALNDEEILNNGVPGLHAFCIHALEIQEGQTVVQVGAGTGYYTAILARMVGPSGVVHAYEIRPDFFARLRQNLAAFPQVRLHSGSGAEGALPACDALYVNAGATAPLDAWLEALRLMGRLIFPLTPAEGSGAMLMIVRQRIASAPARFLCPVKFTPCIGGRNDETARRLTAAFRNGRWTEVRSFRRGEAVDESCWFDGGGWWLSTKELAANGSIPIL